MGDERNHDRPTRWLRRPGRILLAVAGLATVLPASACDTAWQVSWATYSSQLQQIDAAAATGKYATLQALLTAANATSRAHEKATGYRTTPRGIHPGRPAADGMSGVKPADEDSIPEDALTIGKGRPPITR